MERDDVEGAKAAAEYFLALYPYVFATGDLEEWEAMSHPECRFCTGATRRVSELTADGGYASGGEFTVREVLAQRSEQASDEVVVGIVGTEAPSMEYSADGELTGSLPGGEAQYNFAMTWQDGGWLVKGGSVEARETR